MAKPVKYFSYFVKVSSLNIIYKSEVVSFSRNGLFEIEKNLGFNFGIILDSSKKYCGIAY